MAQLGTVTFAVTLAVSLAVSAAPVAAQAPAPTIIWRVENPFRFLTDPADTRLHRATFEALTPEQRLTPVLSAERQLAGRHPDGWAATLAGGVCWDAANNRHRCPVGGGDYVNPSSHRVEVTLAGIPDAATVDCTWLTAPSRAPTRTSGRRATARGEAVTRPCAEPAILTIPYPSGAKVTVEIGGREVAAAAVKVTDLLIVGLGDSFGSGEGNPDVPVRFARDRSADYGSIGKDIVLAGYPTRVGGWSQVGDKSFLEANAKWLDQACRRSLYSHQARAALQLAIEDPHRSVTFVGLACSGAEVTAGLFLRYKGNEWVPTPPDLSQISALAEAQCGPRAPRVLQLPEAYHMRGKIPTLQGSLVLRECARQYARRIDLVFLSVGGNDIGFSRLVANAVLGDRSVLKRLGGWFGQFQGVDEARSQLAELAQRYKAFNRALHYILHVPWEESDRVILTAYPPLALLADGKSVCPSSQLGMDVLPEFALSEARAGEGERAADALHQTMREAARTYGWSFAERHRAEFYGHGICAGFAESSFSSADDLRFPRKVADRWEPYNPADYRAYAPRQRWFRTPNDAYLTGNFHVAGSLLQKVLKNRNLLWTQVLLASTYSGAFHPTAEGHAAIADSVVVTARKVLDKYAGGNRAK